MPSPQTLLVFSLVAAVFVVVPGPSNLFVLARGIASGSRAAIAGAAGCATGALTWVVATAAGLSALLASSQLLFAVVHYAGAAYLCWLGVSALRGRAETTASPGSASDRPWRTYRQGLLVEIGNPKVALFFLALFPQFVAEGAGPPAVQILVLGALFVAIGFVSDCLYAIGSGSLGRWLRRFPRGLRRQQQGTGVVLLGLGAWAAVTGTRT